VFDRWPSPKWLTDFHRFLGGTAVVFTGVHVGTLVADSYVHFGIADVLVPLASHWHPVAVAWGVISLWILVAVEVTSLLMQRLPRRTWHAIHTSSFFLFFTSTLHAITAGNDARNPIFAMACTGMLALVLLLTLVRLAVPRTPKTSARAG
jgi:predicted ferric reductase